MCRLVVRLRRRRRRRPQIMLSGGGGCSRLSPHLRLRDSDLHRLHLHLHHLQLGFRFGFVFIFGLGFYNTRIAHLRCYPRPPPLKPLPLSSALSHSHTWAVRFSSILPSSKSSSPDILALPHCFRYSTLLPPLSLLFYLSFAWFINSFSYAIHISFYLWLNFPFATT